ncbi:phosphate acetyltransferase [Sulfurimonas lithotrophica]|uniref:Phosphate acetyltransferase n=1 Tax=Sulfurimonas lithotrophica TaxID=2590022 RepID=A0A5P8P1P9_9BACT|nr:phosphate acetyltransferase [Sulfurimonas lithotrophica]QFR49586.1 phosphate acetyltransferase [Sulfurimonas lithotrophica]
MKTKSLYISSQEKNAGTLFITMGMMEILKRNIPKVAFFRPIIFKDNLKDGDISFIKERYSLDIDYSECYGYDIEFVEQMISQNKTNELINLLIKKFKKLEKDYDFVLCEGIRHSFLTSTINFDINILIAQNFGSPVLNILSAKDKSVHDIYEYILIENENLKQAGCTHFATFVNRLDEKQLDNLSEKTKNIDDIYLLPEVEELTYLSIADVIDGLDAEVIMMDELDYSRAIKAPKVVALSLDNFLGRIEEGELIIVPADRSEIILGILGAVYSKNYPNIAGIIFPFELDMHPNIKKLIDGLDDINIPLLSVTTDTYTTANNISKLNARLRVNSKRKIALALGMFNNNVDIQKIEKRIQSAQNDVMTPMMFEYKLFNIASNNKKTIVLPESNDDRILRAADIILKRDVANIILLGNEEEIKDRYGKLGLNLDKSTIIDPDKSELMDKFIDSFYEMRKDKGLLREGAADAMAHVNYFATMMVHLGYADGMVSGASHSTGDTIRPALQIIKTTSDVSLVSSVFFMCLKTKVLVYGDCAVNQDPDAKELAEIALSSAKTAHAFGVEPKVALLSYSTGDSGSGADVDKVKEATKLVKEMCSDYEFEGPIQYDAAINKDVAAKKLPNSKVAGEANVLIFPDLNTGNNTYKAVQRSSDAVAIGPILQGLNKPINDLSRGCLVEDIVNTVAITAIQAGQKDETSRN